MWEWRGYFDLRRRGKSGDDRKKRTEKEKESHCRAHDDECYDIKALLTALRSFQCEVEAQFSSLCI